MSRNRALAAARSFSAPAPLPLVYRSSFLVSLACFAAPREIKIKNALRVRASQEFIATIAIASASARATTAGKGGHSHVACLNDAVIYIESSLKKIHGISVRF